METPITPLRGIEIIRKLLEAKKQAQLDAIDNYQNNPELRAVIDQLKKVNGKRKSE